ncbi:MAG TPA: hypothetical protein PLR99_17215 [Polyangiaceae bacterium]|nr:hypothetical protein [Polyangiaceae bacterium]
MSASPPTAPRRRPLRGLVGALFTAVLTAGLWASVPACSVFPQGDFRADGETPPPEEIPTGSASASDAQAPDSAPPPAQYRGNPLCRAKKEQSCWPDDGAAGCRSADAGSKTDAGAPENAVTCRVHQDGPVCTQVGTLADGATCTRSTECGAGSDCALRADGTGQCRPYCCGGSCEKVASPAGGATFCDVAQLAEESKLKVPVCVPVRACKLLSAGECKVGETCAVVSDTGMTSCVPTGPAQVGEACDEARCTAGLNCLGRPGARKCFQLCRVGQAACGASLQCKTSSLIGDAAFGICQPP